MAYHLFRCVGVVPCQLPVPCFPQVHVSWSLDERIGSSATALYSRQISIVRGAQSAVMPPTTPGNQLVSPGRAAVSPSVERGGMWAAEMPTPPTSGTMCGIGCNINVNTEVRFCGALCADLLRV